MTRPRAVRVAEQVPGGGRPEYADAFEIRLPGPDERTAEEWARAALEHAPPALRRTIVAVHRRVLGFPLDPRPAEDRVLGWRIVSSEADSIVLQAESGLLRGVIVGRRVDSARTLLTTFVFFVRRPAARLIWTVVAPLHRAVARYLLARAARGSRG